MLRDPVHLKTIILLLLLQLCALNIEGQNISKLRSVTCAGGSSQVLSGNGRRYFFQQSIGQPGITGLSVPSGYIIRQGFIQPLEAFSTDITTGNIVVTIFPNPFSEHIYIIFPEEVSEANITLLNMNGSIMFMKKYKNIRQAEVDPGEIYPGIYALKVSTGPAFSIIKVIKQ